MPEVFAVIPARGGSVRVPKKNIKLLAGKPLIGYAIEAAKASKYVNRIMVSTDDDEISRVAIEYGANVIARPPELCGDCPTEDVVIDVVKQLQPYNPDIVVCLEPPLPFRTAKHIDDCIEAILKDKAINSSVTISEISQRPEWMVFTNDGQPVNGLITCYTYWNRIIHLPASQTFRKLYYINGIVFACRREYLLKDKSMIGYNCVGIITPQEDSFSLDYPMDFEICEMLMEKRK